MRRQESVQYSRQTMLFELLELYRKARKIVSTLISSLQSIRVKLFMLPIPLTPIIIKRPYFKTGYLSF